MSENLHISLSPETAYATKDNIVYPGDSNAADAAEALADARIEDVFGAATISGLVITPGE